MSYLIFGNRQSDGSANTSLRVTAVSADTTCRLVDCKEFSLTVSSLLGMVTETV